VSARVDPQHQDGPGWCLDVLEALQFGLGDCGATVVVELVDLYLRQTAPRLDQLTAAARAGDGPQVRELAHAIKGSSATLGGTGLAALCEDLELGTRSGDDEVFQAGEIARRFDQFAAALRDHVAGLCTEQTTADASAGPGTTGPPGGAVLTPRPPLGQDETKELPS
jgi:HPt (histidine-containing phosphotransfer) domain-containing protein